MPQPRVLLASVPYALKAADAATLGGMPASAFALAGTRSAANAVPSITPNLATDVTTTGGIAGYVPKFSGTSSVIDSPVFISGADVGIGTTTPAATLDVNGTALVSGALVSGGLTANGTLELAATGTATASTGYGSQMIKMYTSAYNSIEQGGGEPTLRVGGSRDKQQHRRPIGHSESAVVHYQRRGHRDRLLFQC